VCAGVLVERLLAAEPGRTPPRRPGRRRAGAAVRQELAGLARDSSWPRHLASGGRAADVAACLTLDTSTVVPVYRADVDNLVVAHG